MLHALWYSEACLAVERADRHVEGSTKSTALGLLAGIVVVVEAIVLILEIHKAGIHPLVYIHKLLSYS